MDPTNTTDADNRHLLDTLTEEERAAMADDPSEAEVAALKALAAEGKEDDDDEGEEGAPGAAAPAAAPAPATAAAPAEAPAAEAAAAPAAAAAAAPATPPAEIVLDPAPRATAYRAELPADFKDRTAKLDTDFKDRTAKLDTDSKDLATRFKAGEIELEEFQAEQAKLQAERDELTSLRVKAEISQEMQTQSTEQQWRGTVASFFDQVVKAGGIDYRKDEARNHDLDGFVRVLANNPANEDKPMSWFLTEAHKRVQALHGDAAAAPTPAPAAAAAPTAAAAAKAATQAAIDKRKPPLEAVPATLADVPGGDGPGDVGSEFADLDALDGDKLERALASLSPEKRERYLAGA